MRSANSNELNAEPSPETVPQTETGPQTDAGLSNGRFSAGALLAVNFDWEKWNVSLRERFCPNADEELNGILEDQRERMDALLQEIADQKKSRSLGQRILDIIFPRRRLRTLECAIRELEAEEPKRVKEGRVCHVSTENWEEFQSALTDGDMAAFLGKYLGKMDGSGRLSGHERDPKLEKIRSASIAVLGIMPRNLFAWEKLSSCAGDDEGPAFAAAVLSHALDLLNAKSDPVSEAGTRKLLGLRASVLFRLRCSQAAKMDELHEISLLRVPEESLRRCKALETLAKQELGDGNFDLAKNCAQAAVSLSPEDWEAHLLLGDALYRLENAEDAESEFLTARRLFLETHGGVQYTPLSGLETAGSETAGSETSSEAGASSHFFTPDDVRAVEKIAAEPYLAKAFAGVLLRLAFFMSIEERREETLFYCRECLKLDPEVSGARYLLAQEKYRADEFEDALAIFQELEGEEDGGPLCSWYCGEILWRLSREEEALPHLKKSLEMNVHPEAATALILQILQGLGRDAELLDFADRQIASGRKMTELYRARAMVFWKKNEDEKAVADLREALRIDPKSAEAWGELAVIFYSLLRFREALDAAESSLEIQPEQVRIRFLKAVCLNYFGRTAEARAILEPLLEEDPHSSDFLILSAQLAASEDDFQGAKEFYGRVLGTDPENQTALTGIADAYLHLEEWENAVTLLTSAIERRPDSVHFYFQRCLAALAAQKYEMAMEDVNFLIAKKPERSEAYVIRGRIRFAMKQPEAAIVDFQKAASLNPANFMAFQHSAEAKCSLGLHDAALSDLDAALEHSPKNAELLLQKISILMPLRRLEESAAAAEQILEWFPNHLKALFQRGAVRLNLHQYEEALADFDRVCSEDPDSSDLHFARALALNGLFRHEEALAEFDRVLEVQPDAPPVLAEKAMTFLLLNKKIKAKEMMDHVLRLEPENIRILNLRGGVFASMGKIANALRDFRRAIEIQPEYVPALNNLGHILAEIGDVEKGLEYLDSAIRIAPEWARPYLNRAQALIRMRKFEEADETIEAALRQARESGDEDSVVDALELRKKNEKFRAAAEENAHREENEFSTDDEQDTESSWDPELENDFEKPFTDADWTDLKEILENGMGFRGADGELADGELADGEETGEDGKDGGKPQDAELDGGGPGKDLFDGEADGEGEDDGTLDEFSEDDRRVIREFWQQMRRAIQRQKWHDFKGNQEFETEFHSEPKIRGGISEKNGMSDADGLSKEELSETGGKIGGGVDETVETTKKVPDDLAAEFPEFRDVPKITFWDSRILSIPLPEREEEEPVMVRWNYFNFDKKSLSELKEELRQQENLARERKRLRDGEDSEGTETGSDEDWSEIWEEDLSEDFDPEEEEKRKNLSLEETEELYEILNSLLRFMERDKNRPLRCRESEYWALDTPEQAADVEIFEGGWYVEKNFTAPIIINCASLLETLEQDYPAERKMSRTLWDAISKRTVLSADAEPESRTETEYFEDPAQEPRVYAPKIAFVRLREAPKTLFEILTRISEFLDEELQRSRSVLAREEVLERKNQLCGLMDLVMRNVMGGEPKDSMVIFTNFLTPGVLAAIMRSRIENEGAEIDYEELVERAGLELAEMWEDDETEFDELDFYDVEEWDPDEDFDEGFDGAFDEELDGEFDGGFEDGFNGGFDGEFEEEFDGEFEEGFDGEFEEGFDGEFGGFFREDGFPEDDADEEDGQNGPDGPEKDSGNG